MTKIITDSNIYTPNSQLETADDTGRNQLQPIDSNWVVMNPALFTCQDTYLGYSEDATLQFSIGDRIRIHALTGGALSADSDGYYYLVVFAVESDRIYISNYDFIPNDIRTIEFSKFIEPTGWPYQLLNNSLTDTPVWQGDGTLSLAGTLIDVAYRQIGREFVIDTYSVGFNILSGSGGNITFSYPFGNAINSLLPPPAEIQIYDQLVNITNPAGATLPTIVSNFLGALTFNRADGVNWSTVGYYSIGQGIKAIIKPYIAI